MSQRAKLHEAPPQVISSLRKRVHIGLKLEMLGINQEPIEIEEKKLKLRNPFH
jgi:hypothetical protein